MKLLDQVRHLPSDTKVYVSYMSEAYTRSDKFQQADASIVSYSHGELTHSYFATTARLTVGELLVANPTTLMIDVEDGFVYRPAELVIIKDFGIVFLPA